ncbi:MULTISPECIES: ABC transporter permease subunit [unclassified Meridianimarinicoccus]|uniref:ABC transporter permease subunit n=1 Tax=unclassified Meridianimarinicoccus TaxID=2923344 RepID=UPI001868C8E7|nr:ABC transporter permease subunit [Fluviibacterium sp. MJW13]
MQRRSKFLKITGVLGFVFLYAPILSLVIFSFNESKLVTVWGGFSTKWYGELLRDPQILEAAWVSAKIAFVSASLAVTIGTVASFVLIRFAKFRTKSLLSMMITAPLVMPEVIIGLSLLLLFVAMQGLIGWPGNRGIMTIIIAHSTFGAAYAAVVIQSRLVDMDMSIEEAAQDLGAKPVRVFFDVTLPVIAPALVSAWLLAFTLSLDDLVVASFVSGPGASTLPMVIFSKVRLGVSPDVNALATVIIGLVSLGIIVSALQMSRSKRRL